VISIVDRMSVPKQQASFYNLHANRKVCKDIVRDIKRKHGLNWSAKQVISKIYFIRGIFFQALSMNPTDASDETLKKQTKLCRPYKRLYEAYMGLSVHSARLRSIPSSRKRQKTNGNDEDLSQVRKKPTGDDGSKEESGLFSPLTIHLFMSSNLEYYTCQLNHRY